MSVISSEAMQETDFMLYLAAFVFGWMGALFVSIYGKKFGLLDKPNDRSSHNTVVPKGGAIGILAAFVFCSIGFSIPKSFWIPATLLSLLSFWGDRSEIKPEIRLSIQFTASIILLMGLFLGNQTQIMRYILVVPFAVFIVGTANYYNFMDGIDGIAAITGVVGFGLLCFFNEISIEGSSFISLAICMALSCLGFLPFNIPKAKVFMGDVGSVLLGFVFAGMVVALSKGILDFVCITALLFPFYADEITTLVVRIRDRDKLRRPHRKHLYQLLANEKGIKHWKVSVGYGVLQLIIGMSVMLTKSLGIFVIICLLLFYFTIFSGVSFLVRSRLELTQ